MEKLSQDQASSVCGYSRPTISHIENGRIEIPLSRIRHIVLSYGFEFKKIKSSFLRKALAIFHRTLNRHYEYKARIYNLKNPKAGAITVVQRFGGALAISRGSHSTKRDIEKTLNEIIGKI